MHDKESGRRDVDNCEHRRDGEAEDDVHANSPSLGCERRLQSYTRNCSAWVMAGGARHSASNGCSPGGCASVAVSSVCLVADVSFCLPGWRLRLECPVGVLRTMYMRYVAMGLLTGRYEPRYAACLYLPIVLASAAWRYA